MALQGGVLERGLDTDRVRAVDGATDERERSRFGLWAIQEHIERRVVERLVRGEPVGDLLAELKREVEAEHSLTFTYVVAASINDKNAGELSSSAARFCV